MNQDIIFAEALRLHRDRRLTEAAQAYRNILLAHPGHVDAQQLLGSILIEQGEIASGIALIEAVITQLGLALPYGEAGNRARSRPATALPVPALVNLGNGWQKLRQLRQAEACYRLALEGAPNLAEIWNNLGNILTQLARQAAKLGQNAPPAPISPDKLWQEAEQCYQHSLSLAPHSPQSLANIAHFYLQAGRYGDSIPWFERVLAQQPENCNYRLAYWQALRQVGRESDFRQDLSDRLYHDLAAPYFACAADLALSDLAEKRAAAAPDKITAMRDQALAQVSAQALAMATRAAYLKPSVYHLALLGRCFYARQQPAEAEQAWQEAENLAEKSSHRHESLIWQQQKGLALLQNLDLAAAMASYRAALTECTAPAQNPAPAPAPDHDHEDETASWQEAASEIALRLGTLLAESFQPREAEENFRRALAWSPRPSPQYLSALVGLANACHHQDRSHEALAWLAEAEAALPPQSGHLAKILFNRANMVQDQGDLAAAIALFQQCLALAPDYLDAEWNLSHAELAHGDFTNGFRHFEVRFRRQNSYINRRPFAEPVWQAGEDLTGKTLLVHSEQGLGDTLQFCRLVPMLFTLDAPPAQVIFEVQSPVLTLLQHSLHHSLQHSLQPNLPDGKSRLTLLPRSRNFPAAENLPEFDCHIALMSLPHALRLTQASIPAHMPYLTADPQRVQFWRHRIDAAWAGTGRQTPPRAKIGLVWAGESRKEIPLAVETDRLRSMALKEFEPVVALAAQHNIALVSLQKGEPQAQLSQSVFTPQALNQYIIDVMAEITGFDETAALLAGLDAVVTVDTSVAHLAGGMNCPTWLLSRKNGCWRWLAGQSHSPWYPRMKIIHQTTPRQWQTEIHTLCADLAAWLPPA
ncbi:MAG: tetratricopeptide repeat protein [Candidatus Symbiobacter sp.]|nr:tetratricopeptide repeat protein [Candidatus Symbiobacter sp.]